MPDLYRYTPQSTPGPNGSALRPVGDALTEIATLDGWAYVACDGDLPEQPHGLVLEPVEQTPAQILALTATSVRHKFLLSILERLRVEREAGVIAVDETQSLAYIDACRARAGCLADMIRVTLSPDEADLHIGWPSTDADL